jgi:glutathione S-transferase
MSTDTADTDSRFRKVIMQELTLYASPVSLYSGKARSYLIKAGIPYREISPGNAHYREKVLPKAGGPSIPAIELADGTVVRDGTRIIDHFEACESRFAPQSACQAVVSLLFDVIGSEGLLRPAMHYRWNFPDANEAFIKRHFEMLAPEGLDASQMAEAGMQRMRMASVAFGAAPENLAGIESLYESFLERLDAHFVTSGYLLGGKPSIGDFGLIAPLYAHLGRDPYSVALMQKKAIHVFRWVERMNRPELDIGELKNAVGDYRADDEIPETLVSVLQHIATDFVPETLAAAETINRWLGANSPAAGTPIPRAVSEMAEFEAAGLKVKAIAQPYRFFLLKRVQEAVTALDDRARERVDDLLARCNMADVLAARLDREIGWADNREVWL